MPAQSPFFKTQGSLDQDTHPFSVPGLKMSLVKFLSLSLFFFPPHFFFIIHKKRCFPVLVNFSEVGVMQTQW